MKMGMECVAGLAAPYQQDGPETESWWGEIFRIRPNWPSAPQLPVQRALGLFTGGEKLRSGLYHPHYLALRFKECVHLHLY
jgi:hypothetical protein